MSGPDPADYEREPDTRVNRIGTVPDKEVNPRPDDLSEPQLAGLLIDAGLTSFPVALGLRRSEQSTRAGGEVLWSAGPGAAIRPT
jgi:hypothetical protein